jgi:small-conductance mechanosensitive channel
MRDESQGLHRFGRPPAVNLPAMAVVSSTSFLIALGSALLGALGLTVVLHVVVRLLARRWHWALLLRNVKLPFRLFLAVVAVGTVVDPTRPETVPALWWERIGLLVHLLMIGTGAWLVATILLFLEDLPLRRYRTDVPDNRLARRMRTQVLVLRRLTVAVVVVLALGAALLSFPGVKAVGASVLASAGIISVVAAVAAQSTLSNLFAGVQVAFSDAIRLDDVVVVEDEWGRIEEITLSYVVVRLWDDRRLVLPCTYFTTQPFQNWTRRSSALLGAVELDVDWSVDVPGMRHELDRLLRASDLWDRRAQVLQVTDAVAGVVRVRALMTASDAGKLFDLRCEVREGLVSWVRARHGGGVPRQRLELLGDGIAVDRPDGGHHTPASSRR